MRLFLIPFGFYSGFFNHLFDVPEKYILRGELDRVLLRPLNTLFQVVVETMNLELIFIALAGIIIMSTAGRKWTSPGTGGTFPWPCSS